jgi:hypothetical protein
MAPQLTSAAERKPGFRVGPVAAAAFGLALLLEGVSVQGTLLWAYSSGPEAIILVPAAAAVYLSIAVLGSLLLWRAKTRVRVLQLAAACASAVLLSVCVLHPTDGDIKPFRYGVLLVEEALRWRQIRYENVYAEGSEAGPLVMLARHKFRERLPSAAICVHYYMTADVPWKDRVRFVFERRGGRWVTLDLGGRGPAASLVEERRNGRALYAFEVADDRFEYVDETEPFISGGLEPASGDRRLQPGRPSIVPFFVFPVRH